MQGPPTCQEALAPACVGVHPRSSREAQRDSQTMATSPSRQGWIGTQVLGPASVLCVYSPLAKAQVEGGLVQTQAGGPGLEF